jgi:hypothetical protein
VRLPVKSAGATSVAGAFGVQADKPKINTIGIVNSEENTDLVEFIFISFPFV